YDLKGVNIPSQKRYVEYFSEAWLNHKGKPPLYGQKLKLKKIIFSGAPYKTGIKPNLIIRKDYKIIYEHLKVKKEKRHEKPATEFTVELDSCPELVGDVHFEIKDVSKHLCKFWLNTGFIRNCKQELTKWELDTLWHDRKHKKVHQDFKITLIFENVGEKIEEKKAE